MKKDISIVLSGEAGQGIRTVEQLLIKALKKFGYFIFSTSEFMSRVRGGNNTTEIRVGDEIAQSFTEKIDILIVLSKNAIIRLENRLNKDTIIIGEGTNIEDEYKYKGYKIKEIPIDTLAKEIGGPIYSNVITSGLISGIFDIDINIIKKIITSQFSLKGETIVKNNLKAIEVGYEKGKALNLRINVSKLEKVKNRVVLSGTESIGMGALAGGCNFITAYPMSPSTGVIHFLARHSEEFGIVVEQAEDEISAINMILGAWYAGARALTTTSGGGFALMEEGISLSGVSEVPVVIHLAQRPGPATGLPTRTEQADLNLALYAGHGEFPRIIFAPGNIKDGIYLTQKAFNLADKYQIPVIILTDQYFLNSSFCVNNYDFSDLKIEKYIKKTDSEYKRYRFTKNGISPRGIPDFGKGFVCVDSHESDESGHVTEDFGIRTKMVNKRLKKLEKISEETIEPEIYGVEDYKTLIVGWGSTYGTIREVIDILDTDDIAFVYFKQVYPLSKNTEKILEKAEIKIIVENNATSQFGNLIRKETGIEFDTKILKYSGMPFSLEELIEKINQGIK